MASAYLLPGCRQDEDLGVIKLVGKEDLQHGLLEACAAVTWDVMSWLFAKFFLAPASTK